MSDDTQDHEIPTAGLPVPGDSEPLWFDLTSYFRQCEPEVWPEWLGPKRAPIMYEMTGDIESGSHKFYGGTVYFSPRADVPTLDEVRAERGE